MIIVQFSVIIKAVFVKAKFFSSTEETSTAIGSIIV